MEKIIYEYCTLRYVPDIEREEFLNVGLIMMCKRYRWIRVQVAPDSSKIATLYPGADIECLIRQLRAFAGGDIPDASLPVEERYRWMVAAKSAIIQCAPSHPGIIVISGETGRETVLSCLDSKFNELFKRLC